MTKLYIICYNPILVCDDIASRTPKKRGFPSFLFRFSLGAFNDFLCNSTKIE